MTISAFLTKLLKLFQTQVVGSGFTVSILYETTGANTDAVFTIDAATLQYSTNARR